MGCGVRDGEFPDRADTRMSKSWGQLRIRSRHHHSVPERLARELELFPFIFLSFNFNLIAVDTLPGFYSSRNPAGALICCTVRHRLHQCSQQGNALSGSFHLLKIPSDATVQKDSVGVLALSMASASRCRERAGKPLRAAGMTQ